MAEFRETLETILTTPAIGVELPFDDVTLEGFQSGPIRRRNNCGAQRWGLP